MFDPTPNVIIMLADDLGWGDVGFTNSSTSGAQRTPHLDAMAAEGMVLDQMRCSGPTCSPTRASLLTGRNHQRMGITDAFRGFLPDQEVTIAEMLNDNPQADYLTGVFGKWHLSSASSGFTSTTLERSAPWYQGFDESFVTYAEAPSYTYTDNRRAYFTGPGRREQTPQLGDSSTIIMNKALGFMERAIAQDKPFFAYLPFHTPHNPIVANPDYVGLFPGDPTADRKSAVTAMDAEVGRMRSRLAELGQADNTMILFTSDNGPKQPGPGSVAGLRGGKQTLWDGGLRVPGILLDPQAGLQGRSSVPVSTSDFLPTIAAATGSPLPKTGLSNRRLDGIDFMPLLKSGATERGDANPIFFRYLNKAAVVNDQHKVVRDSLTGSWQLFNVRLDPFETRNLAAQLPSIASNLRQRWESWNVTVQNSLLGMDY